MERRGFNHRSPLDIKYAQGTSIQKEYIDSIEDQIKILGKKGCDCEL